MQRPKGVGARLRVLARIAGAFLVLMSCQAARAQDEEDFDVAVPPPASVATPAQMEEWCSSHHTSTGVCSPAELRRFWAQYCAEHQSETSCSWRLPEARQPEARQNVTEPGSESAPAAVEPIPAPVQAPAPEVAEKRDHSIGQNVMLTVLVLLAGAAVLAFLVRRHASQRRSLLAARRPFTPNAASKSGGALFISHASPDASKARRLVECIEAKHSRCWIAPRDIGAGRAYADAIAEAIEACEVFVVLISSASNSSGPVLSEVELARRFNRTIVPVIIDDAEMSKAMLYYLSAAQWLEYGADVERLAAQIAASSR